VPADVSTALFGVMLRRAAKREKGTGQAFTSMKQGGCRGHVPAASAPSIVATQRVANYKLAASAWPSASSVSASPAAS